jgi:oligogalacturonide lyase
MRPSDSQDRATENIMPQPSMTNTEPHAPAELPRRTFLKGVLAAPAVLGFSTAKISAAPARSVKLPGAVGRTSNVSSEIREIRDPETGARVMRLTGGDSDNVHLYFTSESFVGDSNRVVFSSNRSGRFQYYLLEIKERRLVQLTDGGDIRPNRGCLTRDGMLAYFDGPLLRAVSADTLEDRELYRVPDGWLTNLPTCTADGKHVAFAYREEMAVSTLTDRIYSTMRETHYQRPRCVIMRIDTGSGEPLAVWGEQAWISHVLIHPHQPDLILFCHEGGNLVRQRMFTVDASVRVGRQAKPLFQQTPGDYAVHEYFTREGEVGFQYEIEREGRMEYFNAFIRPDGTWIRQYLLPGRRPGHIQSNSDNTLIVGDRGHLSADDTTGGDYMSLMTHSNGREIVRRLCRRVPGPTQHSHGHPVFSWDDKWVIFNSRLGPREAISMADVTSI